MRDTAQASPPSLSIATDWIKPRIARVKNWTRYWLQRAGARRAFSRHHVRAILPALAIVAGAVACGLWLGSTAAGLLACIGLFFLASIGRSLERIAALLRSQSIAAPIPALKTTSGRQEQDQQTIYISSKAMERLRPWVEDESSLTEESAKAYCSVLLDTLAMLHPKLTGGAKADGHWS